MATLAELKTRVIGELDRDDMGSGGESEQRLIDAYTQAIETYANEPFWFNRKSGTVATVASTATVALPSGMRIPLIVSYLATPLRKVSLDEIQQVYDAASPLTGLPCHWAEDEGLIRFYPTPDAVYTLSVYGTADIGVPSTTNEWSTEAYDLIVAETKVRLLRVFKEFDAMNEAQIEREEALSRLRKESRRRGMTGLTTDFANGQRFNINYG